MEVSLRQITYFLMLVEKRSFTTAAEALCITQPALSIAISQLEKALGAKLIERGSLPVTITPEGETFRRYALRVQRDLSEARDELAALASGTLGRLDICMGPSAACAEVSAVLTSMVEDFPSLDIGIQSGVVPGIAERLRTGEFSVYVGTVAEDFDAPDLDVTPLGMLDLAIVAGAAHPLVGKARVRAPDLLHYPWIAIGNVDANLPHWQASFVAAGLKPPRAAINVRNMALVRSLLCEGRFVTILPLSMAQADIRAGTLAPVSHPDFRWTTPMGAITRKGVTLPGAARMFLDRLVAAYK
jgi:DNA-binding transcriptional LysR family regulator